jgi:hypothetical protein
LKPNDPLAPFLICSLECVDARLCQKRYLSVDYQIEQIIGVVDGSVR